MILTRVKFRILLLVRQRNTFDAAVDLKWRCVTHPPTRFILSNGSKPDVFARRSVIIFSAILCESILLKITSAILSCQAIKYFACIRAILPRHQGDILTRYLSRDERGRKMIWFATRKTHLFASKHIE